jgi:hypothetical protein
MLDELGADVHEIVELRRRSDPRLDGTAIASAEASCRSAALQCRDEICETVLCTILDGVTRREGVINDAPYINGSMAASTTIVTHGSRRSVTRANASRRGRRAC